MTADQVRICIVQAASNHLFTQERHLFTITVRCACGQSWRLYRGTWLSANIVWTEAVHLAEEAQP